MKKNEIWFPAKRHGWGWGLPVRWQGWAVLAIYLALVIFGAVAMREHGNPREFFILHTLGLSLGLILVCWWKGEPPRWRWGNRDDHRGS